jgi:hypothetical protein
VVTKRLQVAEMPLEDLRMSGVHHQTRHAGVHCWQGWRGGAAGALIPEPRPPRRLAGLRCGDAAADRPLDLGDLGDLGAVVGGAYPGDGDPRGRGMGCWSGSSSTACALRNRHEPSSRYELRSPHLAAKCNHPAKRRESLDRLSGVSAGQWRWWWDLNPVGAENHVTGADLGVRLMCQTSCFQWTVG